MSYFSERHGAKRVIERTSAITPDKYEFLLDCCRRHYEYIAWKYPEHCPDGFYDCCGLDIGKFNLAIRFAIPSLFRDPTGNIAVPQAPYKNPFDGEVSGDEYDQYSLLDFIEFIGQDLRDIKQRKFHEFFRHQDLIFADTNTQQMEFRKEINQAFEMTGLLYILTTRMEVERVEEHGVTSDEIVGIIATVPEPETRKLLKEAIQIHKASGATASRDACERIWDAFERLKTFYDTLKKDESANKIIKNMSGGQVEFEAMFLDEFKLLTKIGNNFRIRHHETDKVDIRDDRHYDYFFNRCLALIATAVQYLK